MEARLCREKSQPARLANGNIVPAELAVPGARREAVHLLIRHERPSPPIQPANRESDLCDDADQCRGPQLVRHQKRHCAEKLNKVLLIIRGIEDGLSCAGRRCCAGALVSAKAAPFRGGGLQYVWRRREGSPWGEGPGSSAVAGAGSGAEKPGQPAKSISIKASHEIMTRWQSRLL